MGTIPQMFLDRVAQSAARRAFSAHLDGRWRDFTWADYHDQARDFGLGLADLGMKRGETVAILGGTRREWAVSDIGALGAGGVTVGLYPTLVPEGIGSMHYVIDHSEAKWLVVENAALLRERIGPILGKIPRVQRIVLWDCDAAAKQIDPRVVSFAEVCERGGAVHQRDANAWRAACAAAKPDDLAILIYTSGTTGQPKGAMLSHGNIVSLEDALAEALPLQYVEESAVSFLPMAHAAERCVAHYGRIRMGYATHYARSIDKLLEDIEHARPTIFGSVPRIFEKVYAKVTGQLAATPGWKGKLARAAFDAGVHAWRVRQHKFEPSPATLLLEKVFQKRIAAPLRAKFGGRCDRFITGAAPTALEILEFFAACGFVTYECYGMTETSSLLTANKPGAIRYGTVGKALPKAELRIADDGEIQARAPYVFKGYFKEPEATRAAFTADGWYCTGDIGTLDKDGYLRITDRKKNILITAGGKNITPSNIENEVKNHPLISFCHLHADRRPYPVALLCLDAAELKSRGLTHSSPELSAQLQQHIDSVNARFAQFERIKKFAVLPNEFTVEGGELTPTLKVKRKEVEKKYAAVLDGLYVEAKGARDAA